MRVYINLVVIVMVCTLWVGAVMGRSVGREIGYTECVEAINSITYKTPNATYNEGAEAFKHYIIAQVECYRKERK